MTEVIECWLLGFQLKLLTSGGQVQLEGDVPVRYNRGASRG